MELGKQRPVTAMEEVRDWERRFIGEVKAGREAFDFPSSADTAQRAAILRAGAAPTIRGDHLDPVGAHERVIERVAVVAAVADQGTTRAVLT